MIQKISILGCGWLGFPLAKFLIEKGFQVHGSTTRAEKLDELRFAGIQPYLIRLDPLYSGNETNAFFSSDLLIINIPPSLRTQSEDFHVYQMKEVLKLLVGSSIRFIIYISSTSVYPGFNHDVKEDEVSHFEQADNKTLFAAEEIFRSNENFKSIILRCAGLAGYDRNLVKHFAGKKDLMMGNAPVNLIHRDDVIGILYSIIKKNTWDETYNVCAPVHPLRKDLYPYLSKKYGYPLPMYDAFDESSFKIISIEKLQQHIAYDFKYPDPHNFYYS